MCVGDRLIDVGFTDKKFEPGTHMCLIYNDESERRRLMAAFIASGLFAGERIGYFSDGDTGEVRKWLCEHGVTLPSEREWERFHIARAGDIYCPGGSFSPDTMISLLKEYYSQTISLGYPGARLTGEMGWALKGVEIGQLIRYETMVTKTLQTHPITGICQYDARSFDGETLFRVLKVHPYMITNGQVVKNPYYEGP